MCQCRNVVGFGLMLLPFFFRFCLYLLGGLRKSYEWVTLAGVFLSLGGVLLYRSTPVRYARQHKKARMGNAYNASHLCLPRRLQEGRVSLRGATRRGLSLALHFHCCSLQGATHRDISLGLHFVCFVNIANIFFHFTVVVAEEKSSCLLH